MKVYEVNKEYLCSVICQFSYTNREGGPCRTTSHVDHPSFAALREHLGVTGMIEIKRGQWNGDTVLEDFEFNKVLFLKGETFFCGSAMRFCVYGVDND